MFTTNASPTPTQQKGYLNERPSNYWSHTLSTLIHKIQNLSEQILHLASAAIALYVSPSLFCIGIIGGVIFKNEISQAFEKIQKTWQRQQLPSKIAIIIGAAYVLPITLSTASFLLGTNAGRRL